MEIIRAAEFGSDAKLKMSEIFVDGFYQWLRYFSKDRDKLIRAFRHMFNPEVFYAAVKGGEMAGIAACTDGNVPTVCLDGKELRRHLGFVRGSIAYAVLKPEFVDKKYPFDIEQDMGLVEIVATSEKFRGQGVATAIMRHIFDSTPFNTYALEVADTNTNAVKLYEKIGYREFMRIRQKQSKQSGINYLVYMKYIKA